MGNRRRACKGTTRRREYQLVRRKGGKKGKRNLCQAQLGSCWDRASAPASSVGRTGWTLAPGTLAHHSEWDQQRAVTSSSSLPPILPKPSWCLTQCSPMQRKQRDLVVPAQTSQQHMEPGRESGSPPRAAGRARPWLWHWREGCLPFRAHGKEASGVWCSDEHTQSKNSLSLLRRDPDQTGHRAQLGG